MISSLSGALTLPGNAAKAALAIAAVFLLIMNGSP
jgi:hypothetical protein